MKGILIEEQDEVYRLIDQKELDEINASAEEFDGFTGIRVIGEIATIQSIIELIEDIQTTELLRGWKHTSDILEELIAKIKKVK